MAAKPTKIDGSPEEYLPPAFCGARSSACCCCPRRPAPPTTPKGRSWSAASPPAARADAGGQPQRAAAVSPPRQRRKQARPQELLDAALALFVEKGYAATRADEVARRAGVSKGTLYLYYPSKEELFKAPGVAETLDWASALVELDAVALDPALVSDTLGALLKYQDDIARLRGPEAARLVAEARADAAAA